MAISQELLSTAVTALDRRIRTLLYLSVCERLPDARLGLLLESGIADVRVSRAAAIRRLSDELRLERPEQIAELIDALARLDAAGYGLHAEDVKFGEVLSAEPGSPRVAVSGLEQRTRQVSAAVRRLDLETRVLLHAWAVGIDDTRLSQLLKTEASALVRRRAGGLRRVAAELGVADAQGLADVLFALHQLSADDWGVATVEGERLATAPEAAAVSTRSEAPHTVEQQGQPEHARGTRLRLRRLSLQRIAPASAAMAGLGAVAALGAGIGLVVGPPGGDSRRPRAPGASAGLHAAEPSTRGPDELVRPAAASERRPRAASGPASAEVEFEQASFSPDGTSHEPLELEGDGQPERQRSGTEPEERPERDHPPRARTVEPRVEVGLPTPEASPVGEAQPTRLAEPEIPVGDSAEPPVVGDEVTPPRDTPRPEPEEQPERPGLGCGDKNHVHTDEADCGFAAR